MNTKKELEDKQQKINMENAAFIETLTGEDKLHFEAVEQAVKILSQAKVPFFMFPNLLTIRGKMVLQYNNFGELNLYKEDGSVTKESRSNYNKFITGLIWQVYSMAISGCPKNCNPWDYFKELMVDSYGLNYLSQQFGIASMKGDLKNDEPSS
jgi:hypothetical protein